MTACPLSPVANVDRPALRNRYDWLNELADIAKQQDDRTADRLEWLEIVLDSWVLPIEERVALATILDAVSGVTHDLIALS
jgi:hypothetical protein